MADICVIGAGPAGSVFATRMAQLGHDVCLVEREEFPRSHLGESLSPGVLPLLGAIEARGAVEVAGFRRVRRVHVKWEGEYQVREDPREQGLLVDRGRFDALLLERARAQGVRVLQPAHVRERRSVRSGWDITLDSQGRATRLHAAFLAEATGRAPASRGRKRRCGSRTLALYAYWRGRRLPEQPRIESGAEAWYWGVPLPDGTYNTLVFVDARNFRTAHPGDLAGRFRELLDRSELMTECRDAHPIGSVQAIDATPYLDEESVSPLSIRIGDAALALDPLSSSGVQKAIQTALSGAIVCNTLLRRPESGEIAMRFHRDGLADASGRHRRWAAAHYGLVAGCGGGRFWQDRAACSGSMASPPPRERRESAAAGMRVSVSPRLEFVDLPCLVGDFVAVRPALRHPALDGPVAYVGGWELAPLLWQLPAGLTPSQIARSWSPRIPLQSGLALVGWLIASGVMVQEVGIARGPLA